MWVHITILEKNKEDGFSKKYSVSGRYVELPTERLPNKGEIVVLEGGTYEVIDVSTYIPPKEFIVEETHTIVHGLYLKNTGI